MRGKLLHVSTSYVLIDKENLEDHGIEDRSCYVRSFLFILLSPSSPRYPAFRSGGDGFSWTYASARPKMHLHILTDARTHQRSRGSSHPAGRLETLSYRTGFLDKLDRPGVALWGFTGLRRAFLVRVIPVGRGPLIKRCKYMNLKLKDSVTAWQELAHTQ
jgi:hypothetical protein